MPAALKDPDQIKTYCAETVVRAQLDMAAGTSMEVHGTTITIPVERKFGQMDHIQTYCDWVLRQPAVTSAYPRAAAVKVTVRKRRGNGKAHYESAGSVIAIHDPKVGMIGWAMREIVVLHELAHHLAAKDKYTYGHGLEFRKAFLFLMEEFIGHEAGWLLSLEFMREGLPCR